MKTMTAAVRDNNTGETMVIKSEYATKEAFKKDLNSNGYTVVGRIEVDGETSAKTKRYERGCRA
jgi:hypothetical protein